MNERKKLILEMGIFYLIVLLIFGYIIINDKSKNYLMPKIEKKMIAYIDEKYGKTNFEIQKITYNKRKNIYQIRVNNSKNKNLYYLVKYKNKKISDTYKTDYEEGKTLFDHFSKELTNHINNIKSPKLFKYEFIYNTKLNKCSDEVKKDLLNNKFSISIYTVKTEFETKFNIEDIKDRLLSLSNNVRELRLKPKDYQIKITNFNDKTQSFIIKNVTDQVINSNELEDIIKKVLNKEKIEKYGIEYEYLN